MAAAVDVDGNLAIIDQRRMLILRWSGGEDRCLGEFYGLGAAPGYLYYPMDIALDPEGRAYVSQGYEGRVQVYGGLPAAARGDPPSAPLAEPPAGPQAEAAAAVREWARARAEQRVEDDLAAYSEGFLPGDVGTREEWETAERARAEAGEWAGFEIDDLQIEIVRPGIARATFNASRGPDLRERRISRATLLLRRENGAWRILEEHFGEEP